MACATPPTPPAITEITLSSIRPGLADETIIGSGDHSETYKVPGFHIDFHSTLKIEDNRVENDNFWGVDYFRCNTSEKETDRGLSSTRDYARIYYGTYETKYIKQLNEKRYLLSLIHI